MVTGSLRKAGLPPPRGPELVPRPVSFGNYGEALELVDLGRYALNSAIVCAIAIPLSVLCASWAGFAISQLPRRVAGALLGASFLALMVPVTALLVPRFALFSSLGLTDTFVPLVAAGLIGTSPFYVLLYWWAFSRVPRDLFDVARVEGAGPLAIWRRAGMPLVRPVTVVVAVLAGVVTWSNFLDPLIYLSSAERFTLPLGLRSLAQLDRQNAPLLLAGAVMATAPVVIAFLAVQRRLFRGGRLHVAE
jgi:multiple sugar transport system permease protein